MDITDYDEYSKVLDEFYTQLSANPDRIPEVVVYHGDIYRIRAHLNEKFSSNYSTKDVYEMLLEENILEENHKQPEDKHAKRRITERAGRLRDATSEEEHRDAEGPSEANSRS